MLINLKQFEKIYDNNYSGCPLDHDLLVWDGCEFDIDFVTVDGSTCEVFPANHEFTHYMILEDLDVAREFFNKEEE